MTLILIITNTKLDRNRNIKHFILYNWIIHGILGWKGSFGLVFEEFIPLNIVLWFWKKYYYLHWCFNTDCCFSKLALLVLPLELEHSSKITHSTQFFIKINHKMCHGNTALGQMSLFFITIVSQFFLFVCNFSQWKNKWVVF